MATYNDPQEPYFMGQGGQGGQGGQRGPALRDGKRMRKAIQRKTVDFSCPTVEYFEVTALLSLSINLHSRSPLPLEFCSNLRIITNK